MNTLTTKASIRRFLWRYFPNLHEMIYGYFNEEEYKEMLDLISNKENNKLLYLNIMKKVKEFY